MDTERLAGLARLEEQIIDSRPSIYANLRRLGEEGPAMDCLKGIHRLDVSAQPGRRPRCVPRRPRCPYVVGIPPQSIPKDVLADAWSRPTSQEVEAAYANLVRGPFRRGVWASHRWRYQTGARASGRKLMLAGFTNYLLRIYQYTWDLPGRAHVPLALVRKAPSYLRKRKVEQSPATPRPRHQPPKELTEVRA